MHTVDSILDFVPRKLICFDSNNPLFNGLIFLQMVDRNGQQGSQTITLNRFAKSTYGTPQEHGSSLSSVAETLQVRRSSDDGVVLRHNTLSAVSDNAELLLLPHNAISLAPRTPP
jgi:hypothetical protein